MDGPGRAGATRGIGGRHRIAARSCREAGRGLACQDAGIILPLIGGEAREGLNGEGARTCADDLRGGGERWVGSRVDRDRGAVGFCAPVDVCGRHRDGVAGGDRGEGVLDGVPIKGDAIRERPVVGNGIGSRDRMQGGLPDAEWIVKIEDGNADRPNFEGLRHGRRAVDASCGHDQGHRVGATTDVGVSGILCSAGVAVSEIPMPSRDGIVGVGFDVRGQILKEDRAAVLGLGGEVGGQWNAHAHLVFDRTGGSKYGVDHGGDANDVAPGFIVCVGVGTGDGAVSIVPDHVGHRGAPDGGDAVVHGHHVAIDLRGWVQIGQGIAPVGHNNARVEDADAVLVGGGTPGADVACGDFEGEVPWAVGREVMEMGTACAERGRSWGNLGPLVCPLVGGRSVQFDNL